MQDGHVERLIRRIVAGDDEFTPEQAARIMFVLAAELRLHAFYAAREGNEPMADALTHAAGHAGMGGKAIEEGIGPVKRDEPSLFDSLTLPEKGKIVRLFP